MKFPELTPGVLVRRYRRFLADIRLEDRRMITVHVPNTGSLISCAEPGMPVWVRHVPGEQRKYPYSWLLVRPARSLVCIDTAVPNRVVYEYASAHKIPELAGYHEYMKEIPYGGDSRIDLLCRVHRDDMLRRCWVEVKSTTLVRGRVASFPDAVTSRGLKHLRQLQCMVEQGDRALQLYFVQRADCSVFRPADDIDPAYGRELRKAAAAGVGILALKTQVRLTGITITGSLPVEL